MTREQREQMWVDTAFKRRLKEMAAQQDMKVLELTREMARDDLMMEKIKPKRQQGGYGPIF